jgi:hypothetical protein
MATIGVKIDKIIYTLCHYYPGIPESLVHKILYVVDMLDNMESVVWKWNASGDPVSVKVHNRFSLLISEGYLKYSKGFTKTYGVPGWMAVDRGLDMSHEGVGMFAERWRRIIKYMVMNEDVLDTYIQRIKNYAVTKDQLKKEIREKLIYP